MSDDLTRTLHAILQVTACAHCGALLQRIPEDDADSIVKTLGRLCRACHERQEETR